MSEAPATIGRYEVERLLGEGGMGVLYLARDPVLDRHVALKLLRVNGEELRRRFMREAQSAGRLQHPNIVTVYDVGDHQGELYIAMEYIDGDTLATLIRDDVPFSPIRKLDIIDEVADGLGFAHQRGIVHRDIKPANLMISRAGLVKVLDFGIARVSHRDSAEIDAPTLIGTPAYMAPEQLEGAQVDARSDIYAVGLVMYELFSGRRAFAGATTADVLQQVLAAHVTPIERLVPDIDPDLARVIGRAMARQPADRYPDLQAMRKDLARARRRAMQASGDDATVVVGVPAGGAGARGGPPAAVAPPTAVPPAATASTAAADTLYAPLMGAAAPGAAAAPPPPLPGTPPAAPPPVAPEAAQVPDEGPVPVPLPSVPSSGVLALPGAGRSTVDAPVLAAARDLAPSSGMAPGAGGVRTPPRAPATPAPPPVAPHGVVHSSAALGAAVPAPRRGIPAALVVGGLIVMLAVCSVAAFVAARAFGLLRGVSAGEPIQTGAVAESVPTVGARVAHTPAPEPRPMPTPPPEMPPPSAASTVAAAPAPSPPAPAEAPGAVARDDARAVVAPQANVRTPRPTASLRTGLPQTRPSSPAGAALPPVRPPTREVPERLPVTEDAPAPPPPAPAPAELRDPEPPPIAAPQAEGLALVRAYVAARNTAHASGIRRVWPTVDDNHLRRVTSAFSAPLSLAECDIQAGDGARATATCRLTQPGNTDAYTSGQTLTIRRTFVFDLARLGRSWVIAGLRE